MTKPTCSECDGSGQSGMFVGVLQVPEPCTACLGTGIGDKPLAIASVLADAEDVFDLGEQDDPDPPSKYADGPRMQVARAQAYAKGCVIVLPEPRELFVDLDSEADRAFFERRFAEMVERVDWFRGATSVVRPSPSGREGRYHAVVTLTRDVKDATERVLLQSMLGSDPVREIHSLARVCAGAPNPTLFFERKP